MADFYLGGASSIQVKKTSGETGDLTTSYTELKLVDKGISIKNEGNAPDFAHGNTVQLGTKVTAELTFSEGAAANTVAHLRSACETRIKIDVKWTAIDGRIYEILGRTWSWGSELSGDIEQPRKYMIKGTFKAATVASIITES